MRCWLAARGPVCKIDDFAGCQASSALKKSPGAAEILPEQAGLTAH
jgi:hypothetical protein